MRNRGNFLSVRRVPAYTAYAEPAILTVTLSYQCTTCGGAGIAPTSPETHDSCPACDGLGCITQVIDRVAIDPQQFVR